LNRELFKGSLSRRLKSVFRQPNYDLLIQTFQFRGDYKVQLL
jgi:hypothetical protein